MFEIWQNWKCVKKSISSFIFIQDKNTITWQSNENVWILNPQEKCCLALQYIINEQLL